MNPRDIDGVMAVQRKAYFAIEPENADVMESRVLRAPGCCFVWEEKSRIRGYLLGHPWHGEGVPPLHQRLENLPESCELLYLHDLAVDPDARGRGIAGELLRRFLAVAPELNLRESRLVAIQGAERFWASHGYRIIRPVTTYGTTAYLMALKL